MIKNQDKTLECLKIAFPQLENSIPQKMKTQWRSASGSVDPEGKKEG